MVPSNRWFPTNLPERAAWYQNFTGHFSAIGAGLGFTPAEIASIERDNQVIQFLSDTLVQMDAFDDAVRKFREIITEHQIGKPTPNFPANPTFTLPIQQPTGIFERLNDIVDRIRAAANYTSEVGALLMIIPRSKDSLNPESVKPNIKVFAAQTGYLFSITVTNREKSDMWDILLLRKGETNWSSLKTATGKSVDATITPLNVGDAEQIQVRVQLKLKNKNYGQPSDIVYVTVNP